MTNRHPQGKRITLSLNEQGRQVVDNRPEHRALIRRADTTENTHVA